MTSEIKLPPLPGVFCDGGFDGMARILADYATAAVLADRQARWLPIETAPKDGTTVLLMAFGQHGRVRIADGEYHKNYEVWSWTYVMVNPTHWMPLPPAPQPVAAEHIAGAGKVIEGEA